MEKDLLPDSRARQAKGVVRGYGMNWVPIFCANCGKDGGMCPEENMTFICWLCAYCAETYGKIAGTLMMPDEIFWEKVKQEQLAAYGRYLTDLELAAVVEADASPLATLVKQRR